MSLQAAAEHRLEAAYMLTLALGLRRGEVLGLFWSDVSAAEGTVAITIQRQLIRDRSGVHLSELKTSGSRRVLHLSKPLVEALERHRIRQDAEELVRGSSWRNDHDLVFSSSIGTGHPGVDRLAADTKLAGDLGHREPSRMTPRSASQRCSILLCSLSTAHLLVECRRGSVLDRCRVSPGTTSSMCRSPVKDVPKPFRQGRTETPQALRGPPGSRSRHLET